MRSLKVTSLFSGVGGLDLGLQQAGHEIILQVETDPRCHQCLVSNFPGACQKDRVESLWELPPETELLVAGFPCQDVSLNSTNRTGMDGFRTSLVSSVFRLLKRKPVPFVLLENVEGILMPYQSQVEGEKPKRPVIEYVIDNLESLGYTWAYRIIDTRGFGIPQRRKRLFLLASLYSDPRDVLLSQSSPDTHEQDCTCSRCFFHSRPDNSAHVEAFALDLSCWNKNGNTDEMCTITTQNGQRTMLILPKQEPSVGMLSITDVERLQGFPVDWTVPCRVPANRNAVMADTDSNIGRFFAVGNAVSVPISKWIGEQLSRTIPLHKYYSGSADPPLSFQESWDSQGKDLKWARAAWGGPGIGRFEAKALLELPGAEHPLLVPFTPLRSFLSDVAEPPSKQAVQNYIAGLNSRGWELANPVKFCLARHYRFKEEEFHCSALGRSLVWAKCPKPYQPSYWPAFLLAQDDWPEKAKRAKLQSGENSLVVRFMDHSWLLVEEAQPYIEIREAMESQPTGGRWERQFETACKRARQEYDWSLPKADEGENLPSETEQGESIHSIDEKPGYGIGSQA